MELRPYQTAAIEACRVEYRRGAKRVVLVLPTGAGKTCVGSEIVKRAVGRGRRVLWLTHRRELVDQSCAALERYGVPVGAIAASAAHPSRPDEPVQVASIQTLLSRKLRPPADFFIWDECHHAARCAEQWSQLLTDYPDATALGLTATPERGDGGGLAPLWDCLVVGATIAELTSLGFLVPCQVVRPARTLAPREIAQHPVDAYCEHTPGASAFCFCRSVEDATAYAEAFRARGIPAECVHASTDSDHRRQALALFARGEVRVLTNVYVFTEGTDLPRASSCILARGAGTVGIYLQMVGRVLRPHPGKSHATLIDLHGVSHQHGAPDALRVWAIDGKACLVGEAAASVCARCGDLLGPDGYPCESCGYAGPVPKPTEITGDEIKFARKRAENDRERWDTMLRWAKVAVDRGFKSGWLHHKYKAVYGDPPPEGWTFRALQAARGSRLVGA